MYLKNNIFSASVIKAINKQLSEGIINATLGNPNLKKEVNKVLQQANRRIQNVEKAGLASPAVKAVIAERGQKKFSYFSISGLDPKNPTDWEMIKFEYGRAMSFLNNPTSTATGARQYIAYQARELNNIPFEAANKIVDLATNPTIDEYGNVNIFSYGTILDRYKSDIQQVGQNMQIDAEAYAKELEGNLKEEINRIKTATMNSFLDRFM